MEILNLLIAILNGVIFIWGLVLLRRIGVNLRQSGHFLNESDKLLADSRRDQEAAEVVLKNARANFAESEASLERARNLEREAELRLQRITKP